YPMLIVNGCNAGDMYNTGYGFGEDWIGTPDKGAVGFMAHTGVGYTTRLKRYTDLFYEVALTDSLYLKKGIGDVLKEVGKRFLEKYSTSEINISQVQQMSLQGDPFVSLFGASKPDYEINSDNVFAQSIDGEPINVFTDVFNLGLIVRNFGSTHRDSLKVSISRRLSNGQNYLLDTMVYTPVYYKDTLYFEIETIGIDGFGLNQFTINLDPLNEIDELSETNNQTIFEYFVPLGGTSNIFPANYSIINTKETRLVAHSLDLLMDDRTYIFELDTTNLFNSPYRKQSTVQGRTLAKWSVDLFENLPDKDTVVFYWRSKFAETRPQELDIWNSTSFTYINNGLSGWTMSHFQQFDGNDTKNIVLNHETREWEFEKFETMINVKTFGKFHPDFDYENVELTINNTQYIFPTRLCTDNSMNLLAFDKSTTVPYLVLGKPFILDRKNCGRIPQVINNMLNNEIEINLRIEQYIDAMGNGDYVLLFSIGNVTYQTWPASTLAKLGEIGVNASDIQSITDGEPVIILGKKGANPGSATIIKADYSNPTPANEQEIMLDQMINGQSVSGKVSSPKIGPSAGWVSFHQKTQISELPVTDNYTFNIYGIDNTNREILLFENIQSKDIDLQSIDVSAYPYIRLEMNVVDEVNLTPAQLKNWFVIFDGVPEGVLSYKAGQQTVGIEKNEGETHEAIFTFENVSDLDFKDSLAIEYSLFNQNDRKSYIDTLMVKPLNTEESVDISINMETLGKSGKNDVKVFANPFIQAEQNFNNNYINLPDYLIVNKDNTNPILEVTVDGEFIMDGDIVAPSPMIVLRMKDENGTLLKEDTLGVNLYLNEKCEGKLCDPSRISFSSPNVIWTPATTENDFMVEYQPENLSDGIYTLRAEAADASGNPSGTEPYSVSFEIITESQITNFFPYPNPFSTRTQFVFTLTGSEIPDEIIIQIMTVNGTVVREITQDEIGPIKIGHNKTEYAWDGHDEYGDQLANGVYLYKVKIFNSGKEMKHRGTSADRAFKHGIGKLYLLR
ncbi:MAG: transporter, partial [Cyclobacteriaceae bacterium]|nr:transporter [Cyclobacteriaceae bacterium]